MTTSLEQTATLEHTNVTVTDPERTAALLVDVFGWHIRWKGASKLGGNTIHVGTDDVYIALYTPPFDPEQQARRVDLGGLNHIGVVVDDLDGTEERVVAAGITTFNHEAYEPGRRFYFEDHDNIEWEVVSYR